MKNRYLFPNSYRLPGVVLSVVCFALGIAHLHLDFTLPLFLPENISAILGDTNRNNLTDELATAGLIIGLLLVAFSRERTEDEFIAQLRLDSLQSAVYINYLLLLAATLFVYGGFYWNIVIYNMFTVLVIFIIRFRFLLYRYNQNNEAQTL